VDVEDIIKAVIFLAWILSPLFRKKKAADAAPPPAPIPSPAGARLPERVRSETPAAAEIMRVALDRTVAEAGELLAGLDPRLRRLLAPGFEQDILPRAHALSDQLSDQAAADGAHGVQLTRDVETLLADHRDAVGRARSFVAARGARAVSPAQLNSDRIVDGLFEPLVTFAERNGLALELGAPVAVLADAALAEPTRARLGPEALVIPERVLAQPWRYRALGQAFGEYIVATLPGLHGEVFEALNLGAPLAGSDRDPDAVAQMLAAGWVVALIPDFIGAGILGPAYLRALIHELRSPAKPDAVSVVSIDRSGYAPEPPRHLRVHAVAAWLDALGEHERAATEIDSWDEEHGPPTQLLLSGPLSHGQLPLEPARRALALAARELYGVELAALAGRGLAELPGVTDWSSVSLKAERARKDFADDQPVDSGARALLAAAIESSLDSPEAGAVIQTRLGDALRGRRPARRPRRQRTRSRSVPAPGRIGTPQIVEALVLEELLLHPRR